MLQELRQKPKAVRQQYAFWGATMITSLIALFWVVSLQYRLSNTDLLTSDESSSGVLSTFWQDLRTNTATVIDSLPSTDDDTQPSLVPATTTESASAASQDHTSETDRFEWLTGTTTKEQQTPAPTTGRTVLIATTSSKEVEQ